MAHIPDADHIAHTRNTARFFVEHRQIAWAALFATIAWGVFGYFSMPQRKDPEIPVRVAVAACQWPGATAQEVEQLVTRPIEQTIAQNKTIHPTGPDTYGIRSMSLPGTLASSTIVSGSRGKSAIDRRIHFSAVPAARRVARYSA